MRGRVCILIVVRQLDYSRLVIDQTVTVNLTPIILGTSPGTATPYTICTGRVFGELKPNDPDNNKVITDISFYPAADVGDPDAAKRLSHARARRARAQHRGGRGLSQ